MNLSLPERVARLSGKRLTIEENLVMLNHLLCKTYGWDFHTLKKQPIPFVLGLVNAMITEAKEQEKNMPKLSKPSLRR